MTATRPFSYPYFWQVTCPNGGVYRNVYIDRHSDPVFNFGVVKVHWKAFFVDDPIQIHVPSYRVAQKSMIPIQFNVPSEEEFSQVAMVITFNRNEIDFTNDVETIKDELPESWGVAIISDTIEKDIRKIELLAFDESGENPLKFETPFKVNIGIVPLINEGVSYINWELPITNEKGDFIYNEYKPLVVAIIEPEKNLKYATTSVTNIPNTDITIYPNPVRNLLTISGINEPTVATVCSVSGSIMQITELNSGSTEINVNNLANGVYILKLQTATNVVVKRFIKQ